MSFGAKRLGGQKQRMPLTQPPLKPTQRAVVGKKKILLCLALTELASPCSIQQGAAGEQR